MIWMITGIAWCSPSSSQSQSGILCSFKGAFPPLHQELLLPSEQNTSWKWTWTWSERLLQLHSSLVPKLLILFLQVFPLREMEFTSTIFRWVMIASKCSGWTESLVCKMPACEHTHTHLLWRNGYWNSQDIVLKNDWRLQCTRTGCLRFHGKLLFIL